jgi:hypothetical protein
MEKKKCSVDSSVGCGHCGKLGATKHCGRCNGVRYCGIECQKLHWGKGGHKKACKQLTGKVSPPLGEASEYVNECAVCKDQPDMDELHQGLMCMDCMATVCTKCTNTIMFGDAPKCPMCRFPTNMTLSAEQLNHFASLIPEPRMKLAHMYRVTAGAISMRLRDTLAIIVGIFTTKLMMSIPTSATEWGMNPDNETSVRTTSSEEMGIGDLLCACGQIGVMVIHIIFKSEQRKPFMHASLMFIRMAAAMGCKRAGPLLVLIKNRQAKKLLVESDNDDVRNTELVRAAVNMSEYIVE